MNREYNPKSAESVFRFSGGLLHKSLSDALRSIDSGIQLEEDAFKGKGGLGQLVEKYYYGYEPNSNPEADFPEAGVELKTTPLKRNARGELLVKERLVCDMIDFCGVVNVPFEESAFYRKSILMLILFYLHVSGKKLHELEFLFSVLWQLKGKDLLIIRHDYETIVAKIREGKAHELSEGDTMYLGACRKGQKGDALRKQPYSEIGAPKRAFSLKPAYMRTILRFVVDSGRDMVSNTGTLAPEGIELVSKEELATASFEEILMTRINEYAGLDYKQIADVLGIRISRKDKSRYARVVKGILSKDLKEFEDAEEFHKAGIIVKTIRVEANGAIKESMSFENIDYEEIHGNGEWLESRWYEIVTSRFLFVVFRAIGSSPDACEWQGETRYVLDKVVFWTMPPEDLERAERFWYNIRENVLADTLQDYDNCFWRLADKRCFHVRPKARMGKDRWHSPVSGRDVPKKAYWFNGEYVRKILERAYGNEWNALFERN